MLHVFPLGQRLASRNFCSLKVRKAMKLIHGDNCIINKQKKKNVRQKRLVIGWTSKIHKGAYYRCPRTFQDTLCPVCFLTELSPAAYNKLGCGL